MPPLSLHSAVNEVCKLPTFNEYNIFSLFINADAAAVLQKREIIFMDAKLQMSQVSVPQEDSDEILVSKIKLSDLPADFTEHDIEQLLQKHIGRRDLSLSVQLDRLRGFAVVHFQNHEGK
jgi:hypothetical protein